MGVTTRIPQTFLRSRLIIDHAQRCVWFGGRTLRFPPTDFAVLAILSREPGIVYTRDQILDALGKDDWFDRTVDHYIRLIRRRLVVVHPELWKFIRTVSKRGYGLNVELTLSDVQADAA